MKKEDLTNSKLVIGMIHLEAMPGTPKYSGSVNKIIDTAVSEAILYKNLGLKGIMIENMHDVPYMKNSALPEIISTMAVVASHIKRETQLFTGIQILAAANREALAVAHSANLDFIRAEGFVFSHVADEGIIESNAGELLRYRKQIGAEKIMVFTDVKKKHSSHSITRDVSITETAKAAEFFMSDGIIVTGSSTGAEADLEEIKSVKESVKLPVVVGSGVSADNIHRYFNRADAFIVGSDFKENGNWMNTVDAKRVERFFEKYNSCKDY